MDVFSFLAWARLMREQLNVWEGKSCGRWCLRIVLCCSWLRSITTTYVTIYQMIVRSNRRRILFSPWLWPPVTTVLIATTDLDLLKHWSCCHHRYHHHCQHCCHCHPHCRSWSWHCWYHHHQQQQCHNRLNLRLWLSRSQSSLLPYSSFSSSLSSLGQSRPPGGKA